MRTIIGLGYKARVGKDTTADILVREYGFTKVPFALALKDAAKEIFGFSLEQLYGDKKETVDPFWGRSPRDVLQCFGTDCMRERFDKDIWLKAWELRAKPYDKVVVSDVRFPNEADHIHSLGGTVWKIMRNEVTQVAPHTSETAMDNYRAWDVIIDNNGSFAGLGLRIGDVLA